MIVTNRDSKLLEKLGSFGIFSTQQIQRVFFKEIDLSTVRRRLRKLEKADLIRRVEGLDKGGVGWCLTLKAARVVGIESPFFHFNRSTLHHEILLSELRLSLEAVGVGDQWTPEHVLRAEAWRTRSGKKPEKELIPDGICSVVYKEEKQKVAIELELTLKHRARYEKVFNAYLKRKDLWGVWYFVPSERMGRILDEVWRKVNRNNRNDLFMWSLLNQALRDPWNLEVHFSGNRHPMRKLITMKQPSALPGAPTQGMGTAINANTKPLLAA
ncbi:MAG: replication-relaxation family protein [Bdellovibrionota bacterium]